jgi:hypothetical protein
MFQHKVVDITTIHLVVKTDVIHICMFFNEETMDLNCDTFNEDIGYHILP